MNEKYTLRGSEKLNERISKDLDFIVKKLYELPEKDLWEGVVLMGGYGRGEGTPLVKNGDLFPYNDYDIIVISRSINPLRRRWIQKKLFVLEKELAETIHVPVDLYLHTPESLKAAEPSLLNYELLYGHRVLSGSEKVISSQMPQYNSSDIPLSEGTRLLLNRGTLLLYNLHQPEKKNRLKYILKAHLAMGDSLLLILGRYDIFYQRKKMIMHDLNNDFGLDNFEWIRKKYLKAVEFKEWGDEAEWKSEDLDLLLKETIYNFMFYFFWYEGRRLRSPIESIPDYVKALEKVPAKHSKLKNIFLNVKYFGYRSFLPCSKWLFIYPRNRLFPALLLLLKMDADGKLSPEEDKILLQTCSGKDPFSIFKKLRDRFS